MRKRGSPKRRQPSIADVGGTAGLENVTGGSFTKNTRPTLRGRQATVVPPPSWRLEAAPSIGPVNSRTRLALEGLSDADLNALRLSSQVLAHKAALAGLPRVEMFFTTIEAEVAAEGAARGQRGERGGDGADPWRTAPLTTGDRAAITAYLELLYGNEGLSPAVRRVARDLLGAERLS